MEADPSEIGGRGQIVGFFSRWGTDDRHAQDDVRRRKLRRRLKVLAICTDWRTRGRGAEMSRKAIAQAYRPGERRRGAARGEHPDWWQHDAVGNHPHRRKWMVGRKLPARQREHLLQLLRKLLTIERPERA